MRIQGSSPIWAPKEAQSIKSQGQKLGVSLKIGRAKQPVTDCYLDLSLK